MNGESELLEKAMKNPGVGVILGMNKQVDISSNHPLDEVFKAAIDQATKGKGTRHGGDVTPFMDQPWSHYYDLHGRGFLTGQAAKKLEEAASLRHGPEFESEALGAIVYIAMAILKEREKTLK